MARRIEFEITCGAYFLWALALLILPLRWMVGALIAAAVHELWHFGAVILCGGKVYHVKISAAGAVMETSPMCHWKEMICAAAGPVGSFSVLLTARHFPVAAICAAVQGAFNLLPLFPLDGGRVLRCGLELLFRGKKTGKVECLFAVLTVLALTYAAIRLKMGMMLLYILPVIAVKLFPKKNTLQRLKTKGTIEAD